MASSATLPDCHSGTHGNNPPPAVIQGYCQSCHDAMRGLAHDTTTFSQMGEKNRRPRQDPCAATGLDCCNTIEKGFILTKWRKTGAQPRFCSTQCFPAQCTRDGCTNLFRKGHGGLVSECHGCWRYTCADCNTSYTHDQFLLNLETIHKACSQAGCGAKHGNGDCPICVLSATENTSGVGNFIKTSCGHNFHESCLADWAVRLRKDNILEVSCPMCRNVLKKSDNKQIYAVRDAIISAGQKKLGESRT